MHAQDIYHLLSRSILSRITSSFVVRELTNKCTYTPTNSSIDKKTKIKVKKAKHQISSLLTLTSFLICIMSDDTQVFWVLTTVDVYPDKIDQVSGTSRKLKQSL